MYRPEHNSGGGPTPAAPPTRRLPLTYWQRPRNLLGWPFVALMGATAIATMFVGVAGKLPAAPAEEAACPAAIPVGSVAIPPVAAPTTARAGFNRDVHHLVARLSHACPGVSGRPARQ